MIKRKYTIKLIAVVMILTGFVSVAFPQISFAASTPGGGGGGGESSDTNCPTEGDCANTAFTINNKKTNVTIKDLMIEILRFLSIGVGIAVVGGIAFGGITYSTSEGNPSKAQKGITIITNSVLALILYLLMFAIINWLIPGGVLT